jgi:hypothetical protein
MNHLANITIACRRSVGHSVGHSVGQAPEGRPSGTAERDAVRKLRWMRGALLGGVVAIGGHGSAALAQTVTATSDLRQGQAFVSLPGGQNDQFLYTNSPGPLYLPFDVGDSVMVGTTSASLQHQSTWLALGPGNSTTGLTATGSVLLQFGFSQGYAIADELVQVGINVDGLAPGETLAFRFAGSLSKSDLFDPQVSATAQLQGYQLSVSRTAPAAWREVVYLSNGSYSLDASVNATLVANTPYEMGAAYSVELQRLDTTPSNDECDLPLVVTVGDSPFTTVDADGVVSVGAGCDGARPFDIHHDVYFTYIAEASGVATVSVCGGASSMRLAAFSGDCSAPTWLGCPADPACGQRGTSISIPTVCGQSYTIVAGHASPAGATGAGVLTISQSGTCADLCEHADQIALGPNEVSTIGATGLIVLPPTCEEGFGLGLVNEVYFTFDATVDGWATFSTCGTANFDTRLAVLSDCASLTVLGCNDDAAGCPGFSSELTVPVTCGQRVLVALGSWDGQTGTATLTVSQVGSCSSGCAADLNGDGAVGAPDLALMLGQWGLDGYADLSGDHIVGAPDIAILLGAWGPCP